MAFSPSSGTEWGRWVGHASRFDWNFRQKVYFRHKFGKLNVLFGFVAIAHNLLQLGITQWNDREQTNNALPDK